jgi:hypothetical protein
MWRGITKAEVIVAPVPSSTASLDLRVTGNRDRDGYHPHEIGRDVPVR